MLSKELEEFQLHPLSASHLLDCNEFKSQYIAKYILYKSEDTIVLSVVNRMNQHFLVIKFCSSQYFFLREQKFFEKLKDSQYIVKLVDTFTITSKQVYGLIFEQFLDLRYFENSTENILILLKSLLKVTYKFKYSCSILTK